MTFCSCCVWVIKLIWRGEEALLVKSVVYTFYTCSETFHRYYLCCSWYRNSCQTVQNFDTKVYILGTCHLEMTRSVNR
jgi:hypothetical protein